MWVPSSILLTNPRVVRSKIKSVCTWVGYLWTDRIHVALGNGVWGNVWRGTFLKEKIKWISHVSSIDACLNIVYGESLSLSLALVNRTSMRAQTDRQDCWIIFTATWWTEGNEWNQSGSCVDDLGTVSTGLTSIDADILSRCSCWVACLQRLTWSTPLIHSLKYTETSTKLIESGDFTVEISFKHWW